MSGTACGRCGSRNSAVYFAPTGYAVHCHNASCGHVEVLTVRFEGEPRSFSPPTHEPWHPTRSREIL